MLRLREISLPGNLLDFVLWSGSGLQDMGEGRGGTQQAISNHLKLHPSISGLFKRDLQSRKLHPSIGGLF
ncbi:unnamed protein product [Cuscuta campestris]|uniref:Uncharacterized protein n=1 Tax=Cuscuta campestris TaxID=132261 RepID=A0A484MNV7_9ASTE|nr:unnamed protein product [Cuscuta campestris]